MFLCYIFIYLYICVDKNKQIAYFKHVIYV